MKLYTCKMCGVICAGGEEDPDDYELMDKHIVTHHHDELLRFFTVYSLKGRPSRKCD